VKIALALAVALHALAPPAQAQECRARLASPAVDVPATRTSLDCAVAGELDAVAVRIPARVCNADPAATTGALSSTLGAWLNRELAQAGGIKTRADLIRGLLAGDPDNLAFLGRVLPRAGVTVRGLAEGETVGLDYVLPNRDAVQVGFADCYSRAALLAYAGSLRGALQSLLATLDGFSIQMPCEGQQLAPATQTVNAYTNGVRMDAVSPAQPLHYASPQYLADLCAAAGAVSYAWSIVPGAASAWQIVGPANGPRITVKPRDGNVSNARLGGTRLSDLGLSLDVVLEASLPGLGAPRTRVTVGALTKYGIVDAPPPPQITRYWIADYRLNTGQGTLENLGIIDPSLMLQASADDGVVYIEGRDFPQNARFRIAETEMQVLERSVQGDLQRFKARTGKVDRFWIETAAPQDVWLAMHARPVKRLAPFFIQDELLRNAIGVVELGIGSPRIGVMRMRVGEASSETSMAQIEGGGVRLNVEDLRSQGQELTFSGGPGANQVTIKLGIPFESGGDELVGTYEPTALYWVCETVRVSKDRCSDGDIGCLMDAVGSAIDALPSCTRRSNWSEARVAASGGEASRKPLRGQVDNFRIEIELTLGIDARGRLKLDSYQAKSSGNYSLNTSASDLPSTPGDIQALVTAEVDAMLSRNPNLGQALQATVDRLNERFAEGFWILGLSATSGVIFLDRQKNP
jgi:hypothetical protein